MLTLLSGLPLGLPRQSLPVLSWMCRLLSRGVGGVDVVAWGGVGERNDIVPIANGTIGELAPQKLRC